MEIPLQETGGLLLLKNNLKKREPCSIGFFLQRGSRGVHRRVRVASSEGDFRWSLCGSWVWCWSCAVKLLMFSLFRTRSDGERKPRWVFTEEIFVNYFEILK